MKVKTIYVVCYVSEDFVVATWAYHSAVAAHKKMLELLGEEIGEIFGWEGVSQNGYTKELFKTLRVEKDDITKYVDYIRLTESDFITVEETTFFEED